jgi:hypothetical protein
MIVTIGSIPSEMVTQIMNEYPEKGEPVETSITYHVSLREKSDKVTDLKIELKQLVDPTKLSQAVTAFVIKRECLTGFLEGQTDVMTSSQLQSQPSDVRVLLIWKRLYEDATPILSQLVEKIHAMDSWWYHPGILRRLYNDTLKPLVAEYKVSYDVQALFRQFGPIIDLSSDPDAQWVHTFIEHAGDDQLKAVREMPVPRSFAKTLGELLVKFVSLKNFPVLSEKTLERVGLC